MRERKSKDFCCLSTLVTGPLAAREPARINIVCVILAVHWRAYFARKRTMLFHYLRLFSLSTRKNRIRKLA